VKKDTEPGRASPKSRTGENNACPSVAFLARTAFGSERGDVDTVAKSSSIGYLERVELQPGGSAGGVRLSKPSVWGKTRIWLWTRYRGVKASTRTMIIRVTARFSAERKDDGEGSVWRYAQVIPEYYTPS